jgi:hypothetical protein
MAKLAKSAASRLNFFCQIVDSYPVITGKSGILAGIDSIASRHQYPGTVGLGIGEAGLATTFGSGGWPNWPDHRTAGPVAFVIAMKNDTIAISVLTAKTANRIFVRGRHELIRLTCGSLEGQRRRSAVHGAYRVKSMSCPFAPASWHGKHVSCWASSTGLPLMNRPKPQPPVAAYFFESLTMI